MITRRHLYSILIDLCFGDRHLCVSLTYSGVARVLARRPEAEAMNCAHLRFGSVAEWLPCWTQAQKTRVQIAAVTLSGNSLRQTAHTHRAPVHQAAKLVAALLGYLYLFTCPEAKAMNCAPSPIFFGGRGWTGLESKMLT